MKNGFDCIPPDITRLPSNILSSPNQSIWKRNYILYWTRQNVDQNSNEFSCIYNLTVWHSNNFPNLKLCQWIVHQSFRINEENASTDLSDSLLVASARLNANIALPTHHHYTPSLSSLCFVFVFFFHFVHCKISYSRLKSQSISHVVSAFDQITIFFLN